MSQKEDMEKKAKYINSYIVNDSAMNTQSLTKEVIAIKYFQLGIDYEKKNGGKPSDLLSNEGKRGTKSATTSKKKKTSSSSNSNL